MLELALALDSKAHALSQPTSGRLVLKNSGEEPLLVNSRLAINKSFAPEPFREVYLILTNPSGEAVEFSAKINVGEPQSKDFRDLAPGETVDRAFELDLFYALEQPGEYSIQAVYSNQSDPVDGRRAWKGKLESNQVSFVLEP